jgi:hypothetical protein
LQLSTAASLTIRAVPSAAAVFQARQAQTRCGTLSKQDP